MLSRSKYHLFFSLFFLSGFAGLIYESVWAQYIKIILGHAAFAQSFILVVFLAGLSVGAWIGGRVLLKHKRLFLTYGIAELLIGIFALAFHPLFNLILTFTHQGTILPDNDFVPWILIFILTFPSALLLGSTFPVMAGALQNSISTKKESVVSGLYFVNSAGGALGILVAGFILIPTAGLPETIIFAGIFNILIGLCALIISNGLIVRQLISSQNKVPKKTPGNILLAPIVIVATITGASSMMYEIGWIRLLSMVLGSSVQAFELMLSAFIFGLAIGAWWMSRRIGKLKNAKAFLIKVQLMMGIFALSSLFVYNQSYNLMEFILQWIPKDESGYWLFNLGSNFIAFLIMLPATICAGTTLPLMINILQNQGGQPSVIGKVYAMNTLGGIIGVLLGFNLLMPLFGLKYLMIIAGGLDIAAGIGLAIFYRRRFSTASFSLAVASVMFLLISILFFHPDLIKMSSGIFRYGKIDYSKRILFHKDGKTASIAVAETAGGNIVLTTNGKPDASINVLGRASADEATQVLLAALPVSLMNTINHAAIVGLGSGKTAHVLLMDKEIQSVDVVEIEPAVAGAVKYFRPFVDNIFNDHRFNLYIDDARKYLSGSLKKYDLIISEPSNPWISGMSGLFTGQFYKSATSALTNEGLFVQWMHIYEMNMPLLASVVKAFSPHFSDYVIYFLDDGDIVLVGKKNGSLDFPQNDIFNNKDLKIELMKLGILTENDLLVRYIGSKTLLDPYVNSFSQAANSDFYPKLEYAAPKARFLNQAVREFDELLTSPVPVLISLTHRPPIIPEHLGPDYAFSFPEHYRNAEKIFRIFQEVEQDNIVTYGVLDLDLALLVRNVLSINTSHFDESSVEDWLNYLRSFTQKTMPFLDAARMKIIWDVIELAPGYQYLDNDQKLEIILYREIGEKDYQDIISLTQKFRTDLPQSLGKFQEIQLTAFSWALIKTGDVGEVNLILEHYPNVADKYTVLRFLKSYVENQNGWNARN